VAKGVAHAVAESLADAPDDRLRRNAVRALKVAVDDELEWRLGGPVDVIVRADETVSGGGAFPDRELLIFITVGVVAVTLVGQGLTLPALMRALRLTGERPWSVDEAVARLEAAQAALDRLDELEAEGRVEIELLRRMRDYYRAQFRRCMAVIGGAEP